VAEEPAAEQGLRLRETGADVLIVADDTDRNERELAAGELACPDCRGELRPWGWGHARPRWLRTRHGRRQLRPRRSCCRACGRTHVLVPGVMLPRRADAVEVVGEALLAAAAGEGHRPCPANASSGGSIRERCTCTGSRVTLYAGARYLRLDAGADIEPLQRWYDTRGYENVGSYTFRDGDASFTVALRQKSL
jgi:hypothetical protein